MISTTLSSNNKQKNSVFRQAFTDELRRNTPFIVAFCLLCVFTLLVPYLVELLNANSASATTVIGGADGPTSVYISNVINDVYYNGNSSSGYSTYYGGSQFYMFGLNPCAIFLFPILALILALIQFSYLTNRRAMDVFGSLPIRRGAAIGARLTAGAVILCAPVIFCQVILLVANLATRGFVPPLIGELVFILWCSILLMAIPYLLTVLIMALTGTVTENILYPLVLIAAPVMIYAFVMLAVKEGIYGYYLDENLFLTIMTFLFPFSIFVLNPELIAGITNTIISDRLFAEPGTEPTTFFDIVKAFLPQLLVWTLLCAVLGVLAVIFFNRRKSEMAGRKNCSRVLNLLTCTFGMTVVGLGIYLIAMSIGEGSLFYNLRYVFFLPATLIFFIIYQLIVMRSASAMLRTYKTYLCAVPVYAVFIVFMCTNVFGIYNYAPKPETVQQVGLSYIGLEGWREGTDNYRRADGDDSLFTTADPDLIKTITQYQQKVIDTKDAGGYYRSTELIYTMKNGMVSKRNYNQTSEESQQMLLALDENLEFKQKSHFAYTVDFKQYDFITAMDLFRTHSTQLATGLNLDDFQKALQKDVDAETTEQLLHPAAPPMGIIQLSKSGVNDQRPYIPYDLNVFIKAHYTNTIQYLKDQGIYELLQPDYSTVKEIIVLSPGEGMRIERYRNYYAMTNNIQNGIYSQSFDGTNSAGVYDKYMMDDNYFGDEIKTETVTDPAKIEQILKSCYTQHEFGEQDSLVIVFDQDGYSYDFIMPKK